MRTNNYYLRRIANNTGSQVSKMRNELYYLRQIASNTGASVTGKLKNKNHYLRLIAENTVDILKKSYITVISDKNIIQKNDNTSIKAVVTIDDERVVDETVYFYIKE